MRTRPALSAIHLQLSRLFLLAALTGIFCLLGCTEVAEVAHLRALPMPNCPKVTVGAYLKDFFAGSDAWTVETVNGQTCIIVTGTVSSSLVDRLGDTYAISVRPGSATIAGTERGNYTARFVLTPESDKRDTAYTGLDQPEISSSVPQESYLMRQTLIVVHHDLMCKKEE